MPEGIISDQAAAEIAQRHVDQRCAFPSSAVGVFAAEGAISDQLVRGAAGSNEAVHPSIRLPREFWAYIAHHGERGPVPDWPTEDRGGR